VALWRAARFIVSPKAHADDEEQRPEHHGEDAEDNASDRHALVGGPPLGSVEPPDAAEHDTQHTNV
jgi:hypothetical protein